ncbi:MAG: acyl-ACP--UDP-N-acetylglucosamine O-acyltransferase [Candidatus Gastranaerophilales bacterium]|nr:acyl-ACP--UDP-N-acetylglucosamine O-acyltransferase [Candidatus Gastranaerophilales bacterium]
MTSIHKSAVIDSSAKIAQSVIIMPNVIIGENVVIGENVKIYPNVYLEHCRIGDGTVISCGASIGTAPQDLGYKQEPTLSIIGKNCQIREYVTVNRASGEGNSTIVGDNCLLMTSSHVGHNCRVYDNAILANLATLGGHVEVGSFAFIGGMSVVHQNCRIGEMSIMSGMSGARQDIPPYSKTAGAPSEVVTINSIGLKRRGLTVEQRNELKKAYNYIWFSEYNTHQGVEKVKEEIIGNEFVDNLVEFVLSSKRGVVKKHHK